MIRFVHIGCEYPAVVLVNPDIQHLRTIDHLDIVNRLPAMLFKLGANRPSPRKRLGSIDRLRQADCRFLKLKRIIPGFRA